MPNFIDLTGKRFGRLTVIRRVADRRHGHPRWLYRCDCGSEGETDGGTLRRGDSTSCGCWNDELATALGEAARTHGLSKTARYMNWMSMHDRCRNPNAPAFKNYGARGIFVCDRWKSFENYLADTGGRPPGMTLERIDNDGPYSPENCRWATRAEQSRNRRGNRWVTINGETMVLADWAKRTGLDHTTIRRLMKAGRHVPGT